MVDWCRYNAAESTPDVDGETPSPAESPRPTSSSSASTLTAAMHKFQTKFAPKVRVSNMTKATFLETIGKSEFTSPDLFKAWTFEFMKSDGVKLEATRFALHPLKIQQTVIGTCTVQCRYTLLIFQPRIKYNSLVYEYFCFS